MTQNNIELQEKINLASEKISEVILEVSKKIVGQDDLIKNLIIGLLAK
jgi:hypothetical protein